jgi:hypothetical protein
MTPEQYRAAALDLYRRRSGAPRRSSRQDQAVADDLYQRGVSLDILEHLIRLARLRRANNPALAPIRSLAYYRAVLDSLPPDALDPGYIAFVAQQAHRLDSDPATQESATSDRQNPALPGRR